MPPYSRARRHFRSHESDLSAERLLESLKQWDDALNVEHVKVQERL